MQMVLIKLIGSVLPIFMIVVVYPMCGMIGQYSTSVKRITSQILYFSDIKVDNMDNNQSESNHSYFSVRQYEVVRQFKNKQSLLQKLKISDNSLDEYSNLI